MTTREVLHAIVDRLPDDELSTAEGALMGLDRTADALRELLASAPADDEPFDPLDLEGPEAGPLLSHDEVVRRFRE